MNGTFNRAVMDKKKSQEGAWIVNTWFNREDGTEFCQSVHTELTRVKAKEFVKEQYFKYAEPGFYQGAGI